MRNRILVAVGLLLTMTAFAAKVEVHNAAELQAISMNDSVVLMTDLDLSGTVWTPIGTEAIPFLGVFDGNGHVVVSPSRFRTAGDIGLFGYVGEGAQVKNLGIAGGAIQGGTRPRVGSIAGVNAGRIDSCWSMAEIVTAGKIVGGLVGEQKATGRLHAAYYTGLVLAARDTIGGLAGMNAGQVDTCWMGGYAKNGKALVGVDLGGTYASLSFDRRAYYQMAGVDTTYVTYWDETPEAYTQILPNFAHHPAAMLSLVTAQASYGNTYSDHLNDLMLDFTINDLEGSLSWVPEQDQPWITIAGTTGHVVHPCTEVEVLIDVTKGQYTRVVYTRPRRLNDLTAGKIQGSRVICQFAEAGVAGYLQTEQVENYSPVDRIHYRFVRLDVNRQPIDTLLVDALQAEYDSWVSNGLLPSDSAGTFYLHRLIHNEWCQPDWMESEGEFVYTVLPQFHAGSIVQLRDTIYGVPTTLSATNETLPSGGDGQYRYDWKMDYENLPFDAPSTMTVVKANQQASYSMSATQPGIYTFTRFVYDGLCAPYAEASSENISLHTYTAVVFAAFDPGVVLGADQTYCLVADAADYTLSVSGVSGGNHEYRYQWYVTVDGTTMAISGATGTTLKPAEVLTLEAGKTYRFCCKVEDTTPFTIPTDAQNQYSLTIRQSVTAGAIVRDTLLVCWGAHASDAKTVEVGEEAAATGEDLEYAWYRVTPGGEQLVGSDASLQTAVTPTMVQLGDTVRYVRYVRNRYCAQWYRSEGEALRVFDRGGEEQQTLDICSRDIPYTHDFGNGHKHTFTYDGETYRWTSTGENGCEVETVVTARVLRIPVVAKLEEAFVCLSDNEMPFVFELLDGDARYFHVTYSPELAQKIGRTDTMGVLDAPQGNFYTLMLRDLPPLSGKFSFNLDVMAEQDACISNRLTYSVEVALDGYLHQKFNRVLYVDNNPNNGELPGHKLHFISYQWYRNGVPQIGQTGQYYQENGNLLEGSYYCIVTDDNGVSYRTCSITMPYETVTAVASPAKVWPVPVAAGAPLTVAADDGDVSIWSMIGEKVQERNNLRGETSLSAPVVPGMYTVLFQRLDGSAESVKLIVE